MRRWTATVTVTNDPGFGDQRGETVESDLSANDLQKDQAKVAIREAAEYVRAGIAEYGFVQLYKTTAAGTRKDQSFLVQYDKAGRLVAQR